MSEQVQIVGGTTYRIKNGKLHCEHGPAIKEFDGGERWYINGKAHRIDGPAFLFSDGSQYWMVDGQHVKFPVEFQRVTGLSDHDISVLILKYGKDE